MFIKIGGYWIWQPFWKMAVATLCPKSKIATKLFPFTDTLMITFKQKNRFWQAILTGWLQDPDYMVCVSRRPLGVHTRRSKLSNQPNIGPTLRIKLIAPLNLLPLPFIYFARWAPLPIPNYQICDATSQQDQEWFDLWSWECAVECTVIWLLLIYSIRY